MTRPRFVCLSIICVACARSSALRSTGASGSAFFFGPWRDAELAENLEALPTFDPEPTACLVAPESSTFRVEPFAAELAGTDGVGGGAATRGAGAGAGVSAVRAGGAAVAAFA